MSLLVDVGRLERYCCTSLPRACNRRHLLYNIQKADDISGTTTWAGDGVVVGERDGGRREGRWEGRGRWGGEGWRGEGWWEGKGCGSLRWSSLHATYLGWWTAWQRKLSADINAPISLLSTRRVHSAYHPTEIRTAERPWLSVHLHNTWAKHYTTSPAPLSPLFASQIQYTIDKENTHKNLALIIVLRS